MKPNEQIRRKPGQLRAGASPLGRAWPTLATVQDLRDPQGNGHYLKMVLRVGSQKVAAQEPQFQSQRLGREKRNGGAIMKTTAQEAAFYRDLLEQICQDTRKTRARRLAESGLMFWDSVQPEKSSGTNSTPSPRPQDPPTVSSGKHDGQ